MHFAIEMKRNESNRIKTMSQIDTTKTQPKQMTAKYMIRVEQRSRTTKLIRKRKRDLVEGKTEIKTIAFQIDLKIAK